MKIKNKMTTSQEHLKLLFYFFMRPGMYLGIDTTKDLFITFLFGFRHGSNTNYFNEFKKHIEDKHQIKMA